MTHSYIKQIFDRKKLPTPFLNFQEIVSSFLNRSLAAKVNLSGDLKLKN